jgi:hypothetical protein
MIPATLPRQFWHARRRACEPCGLLPGSDGGGSWRRQLLVKADILQANDAILRS